jgi:hypothetical protein
MKRLVVLSISTLLIIASQALLPHSVSAEGTYANIGTTDGADGSADAINFSQGKVWTIDQYGKYIWITQSRTGPNSHWAWSNDNGANWTQGSESYIALTRGAVAYDSINDKLHVIWAATDSNDGIIYRRYGITRDGSNNITAISREDAANVNLQLDTTSSRTLEQPTALWVNDGSTNGILVAIWTKRGTSMTEVRGSMRKLSISAADGSSGNWVPLDGTSDTFSTDPPFVAADKIYGSTTNGSVNVSSIVRGGLSAKKNDLYVFGAEEVGSDSRLLSYRAAWNSGAGDWSTGWQTPVVVGQVNTTGGGYTLKYQLITKPVLDTTNDRLYIGWPRWKDNTFGDTVSIAYLDTSDTPSSVIDVYNANGTHSYAPTLDIAYDQTLDKIYISYVESTTNGENGSIDYKTYDGTSLSAQTRFYTSPGGSAGADGSADIPILYEGRQNGRLLFAFRVNGALPPTSGDPHTIYWGYITLPTPTSTPTQTPTPTTASSSNTLSQAGAPTCSATIPEQIPWLVSGSAKSTTSIILSYQDTSTSVTDYTVEYGTQPDSFDQSALKVGGKNDRSVTIGALVPNTMYYFRVRAGNECAVGKWSNTLSVKTTASSLISKLLEVTQTKTPSPETTPTPSPSETKETVSITPIPEDAKETYELEVKVVDNENKPVEGAEVQVHSDVQKSSTDANGIAKFTNVEKGQHIISIAYAGYEAEQTIFLQGDQNTIAVTLQVQKSFQYLYLFLIPVFILLGFFISRRFSKKAEKKEEPSLVINQIGK